MTYRHQSLLFSQCRGARSPIAKSTRENRCRLQSGAPRSTSVETSKLHLHAATCEHRGAAFEKTCSTCSLPPECFMGRFTCLPQTQ
jgi:hypothetical protein